MIEGSRSTSAVCLQTHNGVAALYTMFFNQRDFTPPPQEMQILEHCLWLLRTVVHVVCNSSISTYTAPWVDFSRQFLTYCHRRLVLKCAAPSPVRTLSTCWVKTILMTRCCLGHTVPRQRRHKPAWGFSVSEIITLSPTCSGFGCCFTASSIQKRMINSGRPTAE